MTELVFFITGIIVGIIANEYVHMIENELKVIEIGINNTEELLTEEVLDNETEEMDNEEYVKIEEKN